MRLQILFLMVSIHEMVVFLYVLGSFNKHDQTEEIDQCWVQPPKSFCGKRCTRMNECMSANHTCCWTYCGNICLDNGEPFKTLMKL